MPNNRRYDYDRRLLPNPHLARLEPPEVQDWKAARHLTGRTPGYPTWNLLYYCLYCSLPVERYEEDLTPSKLREDPIVVETGTNYGISTIVMAQALEDAGVASRVLTVERDEEFQAIARENVEAAGLSHRVSFTLGRSIKFLSELDRIDFLYLDDNHAYEHVIAELDVVESKLGEGASVFFDNTLEGGVAQALEAIPERYGGNIVHFRNCSLGPPGNAIWQR